MLHCVEGAAELELRIDSQAGRLDLARRPVPLPRRLLAGRRAVLGALAAGAELHLQQCLAHTRHVRAPEAQHNTHTQLPFPPVPVFHGGGTR